MQNSPKAGRSGKRDALFLSLSGIFLTTLILGNIIGTTKFVTLFSFGLTGWLRSAVPALIREGDVYALSVPVEVLAYPFTFPAR